MSPTGRRWRSTGVSVAYRVARQSRSPWNLRDDSHLGALSRPERRPRVPHTSPYHRGTVRSVARRAQLAERNSSFVPPRPRCSSLCALPESGRRDSSPRRSGPAAPHTARRCGARSAGLRALRPTNGSAVRIPSARAASRPVHVRAAPGAAPVVAHAGKKPSPGPTMSVTSRPAACPSPSAWASLTQCSPCGHRRERLCGPTAPGGR